MRLIVDPPNRLARSAFRNCNMIDAHTILVMNEFVHILLIVGRIAAFGIGCSAFYLAFFLYPNQEGELQNRIEDFWITVNDRARDTGRLSTALFNRISAVV